MHRRTFLEAGGAAAFGLAIGGCSSRVRPETVLSPVPRRRLVELVPVDASWDRIIRTTVGLRPHRDSGFVLRAERFDEKTVIHNFGHGGSGMSLSWGTASLAADLAVPHTERRAAVIGCGIVGLTSARMLQRRGFEVTIYAASVPPNTTSNMSWAAFTPTSGLVSADHRTPEWDEQFRRAVEIAYREHQLLVGSRYGVSWLDEYTATDNPNGRGGGGGGGRGAGAGGAGGGRGAGAGAAGAAASGLAPLLSAAVRTGSVVLGPGEHPFASQFAIQRPTIRFEPSIYLDALMRDVLAFGGHIVVRAFEAPRDLMSLNESLIVNCSGLGAKALFGDEELIPEKGQLAVLVPQAEVTYSVAGMMPRSDGIVLGHVSQRGVWSLDVDEDKRTQVVDAAIAFFATMRSPSPGMRAMSRAATSVAPAVAPPVESFFGRES
jgi:glycine/D-amino acid oxidase-like deaminating enzyme